MLGSTTRMVVSHTNLMDTREVEGVWVNRHNIQLREIDPAAGNSPTGRGLNFDVELPAGTAGPASGTLFDLTIAEVTS